MTLAVLGRGATRRTAVRVLVCAFPGRTLLMGALALTGGALPALFAVLVGRLVDLLPSAAGSGLTWPAGRLVLLTLGAIGAVLLLQEIVGVGRELAVTDLYRRFDEYLLDRIMAAATSVPGLDLFDDPELAAKVDRAARAARYGPGELVSGLSAKWTAQARGLAAAVLVGYFWPLLALLLVVLWAGVGLCLQANYHRGNPFWAEPLRRALYLKRLGLLAAWAKEVRIFGLVDWLGDQFGGEWSRVMHERWQARQVGRRTLLLLGGALVMAHLVLLALAARSALAGTLAPGALVVLVQGLFGLASLASQQGDVWIENGAVPIPDVLELERAAAGRAPRTVRLLPARGMPHREIRFEGVSFAYTGRGRPVFEDFDLTIPAGESLAIVGLNGAGKTTLIKLLAGLSRPQAGRVAVDGIDLDALDQGEWRRTVAAIFQDFVHYELPARDNIGFGAVESLSAPAIDDVVRAAAARAGADRILARLPHGLDTPLSRRHTRGVDLSGGQWQLIALARAMMAVGAGARVLVLDEPTAHLDVRAEADLYDRFLGLTTGLTTIAISHRFSTVRRAGRIVVLESGRIVEDGSHQQLVEAGGRYARLFRLQAMRYEDQEDG